MHSKIFYAIGLGALILAGGHAEMTGAQVKAPPLPPGSERVVLQPGEDPQEEARGKSAHKQKQKKTKGPSEHLHDNGASKDSNGK